VFGCSCTTIKKIDWWELQSFVDYNIDEDNFIKIVINGGVKYPNYILTFASQFLIKKSLWTTDLIRVVRNK
jgi:hypothetical protein